MPNNPLVHSFECDKSPTVVLHITCVHVFAIIALPSLDGVSAKLSIGIGWQVNMAAYMHA